MRVLLFLVIVAAVALYFTNPNTDEVRAAINDYAASKIDAGIAGGNLPNLPPQVGAAIGDKVNEQTFIQRQNYYLFSVYHVTMGGQDVPGATPETTTHEGGQQLPGCLIGIAKQAIPYDKC